MNPITGALASKAFQAVTRAAEAVADGVTDAVTGVTDTEDTESGAEESDFEGVLKSMLVPDQANMVNEEELFAAVVKGRIQDMKGAEGVAKYEEALATAKANHTEGDGYCWLEDAVGDALKDLEKSGVLSSDEAKQVYSESFAAAQLDDNKDALFDGKGGGNDPTRAVNDLESALMAAKLMVEKITSGEEEVEMVEVGSKSNSGSAKAGSSAVGVSSAGGSVTPQGNVVDGPNNFLFKPVSDNEGTLAVLMPSVLKNQVESLVIMDSAGNVLEEGHSTGYGDTGEREKFAFSKAGGTYPADLVVEARLANGSVQTWKIPDPSQRYD